jgi:riboflavin kinase / FMN adenylyltransferase
VRRRIFRTIDITERFKNPVLTIGNYDGLHLGHRRLIEKVKERARELDGTSMLMTFHPHPLHVLRPDREVPAITPEEQKERVIADTGLDVLFVVPFTEEFSKIGPEDFVRKLLVDALAIKGLVIGYDFKFGAQGKGNVTLLQEMGREYGFFVEVVGAIDMDGQKVGSNRVRSLLREGDVATVERLLGRPYMIAGTVVHAKGRGKGMGFPTINLQTDYPLIPANGVYVTEVETGGRRYGAVTNIGFNPTFGSGEEQTIETFILDFEGDLYDKEVRLYFRERIRDEARFASVDELKARIARDVEAARAKLSR